MVQAKIRMMSGRRAGLSSHPAFTAPQKTSATFIQGAPVKLASGNLVACSTANKGASSLITYVNKSSAQSMIGFSQGKAIASSTNELVVSPIREGMEFAGNLVEKSAASAVAAASNIGDVYYLGLRKSVDTHYGWTADTPGSSSGSYVQGRLVDLIDLASTVNGRVLVQITVGGELSAF